MNNLEYRPYFVTYSFSNPNSIELKRCAPFVFRETERLYHHIQSRTVTNHARKPERFPYSFEFFDVANTRKRADVNLIDPRTPHVHAVMLIHRTAVSRLDGMITEKFESIRTRVSQQQTPNVAPERTFRSLTSVHAERVDLADLPEVVAYAAKLLENDYAQKLMAEVDLYAVRTPPSRT
jgi:hypothetical protein